jgi:hypothetical protein
VKRLVLALAVATVLVGGCRDGSDDAGPGRRPPRANAPTTVDNPAYSSIEDALRAPGNLVVCDRRSDAGDASGSYERRTFTVATGACPPGEGASAGGAVVVNAYDSTQTRDQSAAIDFGDRLVSWTYLQFVISVTEGSPGEVVAGVETAMAALGAERTYDERAPTAGGR